LIALCRARTGHFVPVAIVAILICAAPFVLPPYVTFEFSFAGAYAIAILGLIVLTGNNGQISLGHGAFVAIGGYTVAILHQRFGLPIWAAVALAPALSGLIGVLVGTVALRLSGAYLALATFALAVTLPPTIKRFGALTGGSQGIALTSLRVPRFMAGLLSSERLLYYITWGCFAFICALTAYLLAGRLGRALRALRDFEIAAVSFGIDPFRYKSLAFGWSAAYAGIAGALLALLTSYVSPDAYSLQLSITLIIGAVLGGLGTLWGAIVGGIVIEFLPLWAQSINPAAASIVYGIALIAVMIAMPAGIAGTIVRGLRPRSATHGDRPDRTPSATSSAAGAAVCPHAEGTSTRSS
jgi:branched-chain amino acid transport system permease protein